MLTPLLLAAASTAPATPADPSTVALKPLGKWVADWGDASCHAMQLYGDPEAPLTFALRPSINGDGIRLILSKKGYRGTAEHFPITVGDVATTALGFTPRKSKNEVTWINLDRSVFDRLATAPVLKLRGPWTNLDLSTTGMAAAVRAMDKCNADLRAIWNADAAGAARIATRATRITPIEEIYKGGEYPSQARHEGKSGSSSLSVLIDEQGTPSDCVIEVPSGVATLDAQACALVLERAKFNPARDAQGKPIKSRITLKTSWKL